MARRVARPSWCLLGALTLAFCELLACNDHRTSDPGLSKASATSPPLDLPIPPANGPKLGSVANVTFVVERPAQGSKPIGYLHAGAIVARAKEAYGTDGCPGGWYPIRPRGFVCVGQSATLDLNHPTLSVMAIQPKLDDALPYTYARTRSDANLYEVDPAHDNTVRKVGMIPNRSGAAIVGSWNATDEQGAQRRLALLTDGRFLDAADLAAIKNNTFKGAALDDATLPLAFVVKRGAQRWLFDGDHPEQDRDQDLGFHSLLRSIGSARTIGDEEFLDLGHARWARQRDLSVIRARSSFPDFVSATTRWIDVSILAGTAVLYEGQRPVYASLVSVGRDRLGDPTHSASTARGEFPIVYKHVTAAAADPKTFADRIEMFDAPWALELASGQWIYGAFWHDRFGTEHSSGNLELSPADAAYVWHWVKPELPDGWHGVAASSSEERTMVSIHE